MKKIIGGILAVGLLFVLMWILPHIANFCVWLVSIDNTEFGFPWWLDAIIDAIAGGLAFSITKLICSFFGIHDKESKVTLGDIFSILVGFSIALVVHIFLKYWIIILSIIGTVIVAFVIILVLMNRKENKNKSNIVIENKEVE